MIVKNIKTSKRIEAINITNIMYKKAENVKSGMILIYTYTTAAVTINKVFDAMIYWGKSVFLYPIQKIINIQRVIRMLI